jgi:hypothetical protein
MTNASERALAAAREGAAVGTVSLAPTSSVYARSIRCQSSANHRHLLSLTAVSLPAALALLLHDAACRAAAALCPLHRHVLFARHDLVLIVAALCLAHRHRRPLLGIVDALVAHVAAVIAIERSSGLAAVAARAIARPGAPNRRPLSLLFPLSILCMHLRFLCKVGGAGMTWGPPSTCSDQAKGARSAAELDSRLSKKVRSLADTCAVQLLIKEPVERSAEDLPTRLMREASAVGARAWLMPDGGEATRAARAVGGTDERADEGGVGAASAHMDCDTDEMIVDDVAAPLPQATQLYGAANDDDDEEYEIDEAVRRAPIWQVIQQYGGSSAGDDDEGDDDEAVRRCGWPDARMAESPRGLAARWAASGLEMDDELKGEPSAAREEAECMSEMAPDDAHDELMCSMDVVGQRTPHDRLRHSKIVGAFISGKCGGLGLRPVQSTMAAGIIDERARAFGGRRGEPARAVQLGSELVRRVGRTR